jgi:uncharacterized protein (DUF302 family)
MLLERISRKTPHEVRISIERILKRRGFELVAQRDVSEDYIKRGHAIMGDRTVYEISNPAFARRVVPSLPQSALFIPWRIAVYVRKGRTRILTLTPSVVARNLFGLDNPGQDRLPKEARGFEKAIKAVVCDLCRA